ncbi:MAG: ATP-binding cassette domain-containing protein [Proteobacteria bacterium]|nr:ATP-binding cassette domain-containing protein [Pseudomonadota bacterium]
MIEVTNLEKKYGDFAALHGISFKVEKGEILGLLGPNGAGKSTTMKILSAFMPASSGSAKVAGFDVFEDPMEIKKRVGYLPENPPLYLDMRVKEYLEFVAQLKQLPNAKIPERVHYVLSHCGLDDRAQSVIRNLSKGYRQRVGIAQAIVHDPEVVILDEPTVGLDPVQIVEIRNLIKNLAKTHTVILSTHILPEVMMTCDRVVLINRGRVLANGSVNELTQGSGGNLEQAYLKIISQDSHQA